MNKLEIYDLLNQYFQFNGYTPLFYGQFKDMVGMAKKMTIIIPENADEETYKDVDIYVGDFPGGISLGTYILMSTTSYKDKRNRTKKHEYGHSRQSLYLGPLYLIIIGLPSALFFIMYIPLVIF